MVLATLQLTHCVELNTEESLRAAVKKRPNDPQASLKLAQWHLKWGELSKAKTELLEGAKRMPAHAWQFKENLGDLSLQRGRDERAAETYYKEAVALNPGSRHSVLQFGMLRSWRGYKDEAQKLFRNAVQAGMLSDWRRRPLEARAKGNGPLSPWHNALAVSSLVELSAAAGNITAEYLKWAHKHAKDGELDADGVAHPYARGRWRHFWIHRPRYEKGTWRDACHYKTPSTCRLLKKLNNTGPIGSKLVILRADFDVLEPHGHVRPHCHKNDRESTVLLPLLVPRLGPEEMPQISVGGERRPLVERQVMLFDGTFETEEEAPGLAEKGVGSGHDYGEELRRYYSENGLDDKVAAIPDILAKWAGKEEKMMREVRKKYLQVWKGERVALRLIVRNSVLKAPASGSPPEDKSSARGAEL